MSNITRTGHDGIYRLVHKLTRTDVQMKEVIKDKRDDISWVITGGMAPHTPASTGKVFVRDGKMIAAVDRTFFPGVLDLEWVKQ